jgi:hypothetical protein
MATCKKGCVVKCNVCCVATCKKGCGVAKCKGCCEDNCKKRCCVAKCKGCGVGRGYTVRRGVA